MTYYGLSLKAGTLGGSAYLNVALMGVVELAGFAVCLLLLERLGRRVLCSGMFLAAGVACTSTLFPVLYAAPGQFGWMFMGWTDWVMGRWTGLWGGWTELWGGWSELWGEWTGLWGR